MIEKYLPLGTIILLKNSNHKVMIIGYAIKDEKNENNIYDYLGCPYPEGVLSSKENLVFNHDRIDKVFSEGYRDEDWKKLIEFIKGELLKESI